MRISSILFIFLIPVVFSCQAKNTPKLANQLHQEDTIYVQYIDTFLLGDINGDHIRDTAFQFSPFFINPNDTSFNGTKNGDVNTVIRFSCKVDSILSESNLWGEIYALPDLNADGYAEILVRPTWFISCWEWLLVYTFDGSHWKIAGKVHFFGCEDDDYVYTDHVHVKRGKAYLTGEEMKEDKDGNWKKQKLRLVF